MALPTKMRAMEAPVPGLASQKLTTERAVPWPVKTDSTSKHVLVKVEYAAVNPVDWRVLEPDFGFPLEYPAVVGCDMAGTVAAAEQCSVWQEGDSVWAYTGVGLPYSGTFAEYVQVPAKLLGAVPASFSKEAASTLGVGTLTACLGLFEGLKLSPEFSEEHGSVPVLVYGASSVVGAYTVSLLKSAGYRVVAVASSKHHGWLKERGADETADYREAGWVDAVASNPANAGMTAAYDAIGGEATMLCDELLQKVGAGEKAVIATADPSGKTEKSKLYPINLATAFLAEREALEKYVKLVSGLAEGGKLPPVHIKPMEGLEAVVDAMAMLKEGKVSGEKIVIKV